VNVDFWRVIQAVGIMVIFLVTIQPPIFIHRRDRRGDKFICLVGVPNPTGKKEFYAFT